MADLPNTLFQVPVLPVRDLVLFPGIIAPLFVGRPRSLRALEQAMLRDKTLFVVAQREMGEEDPTEEDLYPLGTLCTILQRVRLPDGTTKILVEGKELRRIEDCRIEDDFFIADLAIVETEEIPSDSLEALRRTVLDQFERYVTLHPRIPADVLMSINNAESANQAADLIASHLLIKVAEKQRLLEVVSAERRLEGLLKILIRETDLLELEHDIHDKVRQEMEKGQREYYLREQLKIIQDELGQGQTNSELDEFRAQIEKARMPKEIQKKAFTEVDRLAKMPPMSAEATVARTYLDWLVGLPWQKQTRDRIEVALAQKVLDEDHYGLEEVKDRILEFLSVKKMAGSEMKGQVLCLVGPPGVGKTSLGRSIARALNRKFVSMSLGGVRDEAEIRGHRKTYVGALPGRIIQKINQACSRNPVMLLDEIDKLGADFRGDPSAALLEVLDPEQNHLFTDHYLEVPFDLSRVMFITTANSTHSIPRPLLDRMELISIPGYVAEEKVHIVKRHLWPRVLREHGLEKGQVHLSDPALRRVISDYTREAGVRNLERQLSRICRKATRIFVAKKEKGDDVVFPLKIGTAELQTYLGSPRSYDALLPREPQKGSVIGLAWTQAGGDVLIIEALTMKGKGHITLTGNLGEIMQESAKTALGFLRGNAEKLGLQDVNWEATDLHVHVPEGAIPKDGPSAGITLALAIYSCLADRKVRNDVAMTGEITLRGEVLPIGGLREKILAARRNGITEILFPEANEPDIRDLPQWVRKGMTFKRVSHVMQVFEHALLEDI